jgi:hypothetical protein
MFFSCVCFSVHSKTFHHGPMLPGPLHMAYTNYSYDQASVLSNLFIIQTLSENFFHAFFCIQAFISNP